MKKTITYHYRGLVERGRRWVEGYSETTESGAVIYPWQPRTICRKEASTKGAKAVFVRQGTARTCPAKKRRQRNDM